MLNHIGTKTLETNRILLRTFQEEDVKDMYENWASDDEVTKYLTWPTHKDMKVTESIVSMWLSKYSELDNYHWAIVLKDSKKVIGTISLMNIDNHNLSCEVGYCIGRPWWNQGLVTEVFKEVIRFGLLVVGFERITARHDVVNAASGRVMEKCGLQYEGTLRKVLKNGKGELVDCRYYSILKSEMS
ncbi:GNAT family N-acetyltransferase [Mobilitalea sibirica]|uniref:GNAT family N-acetyltransferase n=1 Tax=Mobilitalea sibirica TaxID=1462919 RepID=A0A8J7KW70_9FIRM|nr:GNAT family N-acetyltransferase [Mobilitalea sibirica]MBH1941005.1 GNAT family N-acetyltransferase [Mobilitalea sibirica]